MRAPTRTLKLRVAGVAGGAAVDDVATAHGQYDGADDFLPLERAVDDGIHGAGVLGVLHGLPFDRARHLTAQTVRLQRRAFAPGGL